MSAQPTKVDRYKKPLLTGRLFDIIHDIGSIVMCMLDTIHAKRDEIYAIARKHKAEKLWVFGSVARKEERPDSDVDFLVEFGNGSSLLSHVHLMESLRQFFGKKVDVVSSRGIHPYIKKFVLNDAVAI